MNGEPIRQWLCVILVILTIAVVAVPGLARELRVTTPRDLINCVEGLPLQDGPDGGLIANPGDECVVLPGTYNLSVGGATAPCAPAQANVLGFSCGTAVILVENLTLRSTDGYNATFIFCDDQPACVNIAEEGVTLGGSQADQGFTITSADSPGVCVTNHDGTPGFENNCIDIADVTGVYGPAGTIPQQLEPPFVGDERITIQNNSIQDSSDEGVLFNYTNSVDCGAPNPTAVDTVQILNNRIFRNGADGIGFDATVSTLGRRGQNRNVVIDGNIIENNLAPRADDIDEPHGLGLGGGCALSASEGASSTGANIHFYTGNTIEELAITNNTIFRAFPGCDRENPPNNADQFGIVFNCGDGILFDNGFNNASINGPDCAFDIAATPLSRLNNIRHVLIANNMIQFNTQNGIKFDFGAPPAVDEDCRPGQGRLDEDVIIRDNTGDTPQQGITKNGPGVVVDGVKNEGNGIYITMSLGDVEGLIIDNNNLNSNYGFDDTGQVVNANDITDNYEGTACRDGNGLSIEANGRVEGLEYHNNDARLNFNNGLCIANRGDVDGTSFMHNIFRNNGVGDLQGQRVTAPYGDGMGIYHDDNIAYFDPLAGGAAPFPGGPSINGFRVENLTFVNNLYRENGGSSFTAARDNNTGCAPAAVGVAGLCVLLTVPVPVTRESGLGFGLFIRTQLEDIQLLTFEEDQFLRNVLGGARLDSDNGIEANNRSGDISQITFHSVQANENEGNIQLPSFAFLLTDNGDGVALLTDSGDIEDILYDPSQNNNNGGTGLRIDSDGSAEWAQGCRPGFVLPRDGLGAIAPAGDDDCEEDENGQTTDMRLQPNQGGLGNAATEPGDANRITILDSEFTFNGTRAAIGRGSGILISAENVRAVETRNNIANSNNDHGLQVSGSRDVGGVTVEDSTFESNDRNTDTIGDGVQISGNEDVAQVLIQNSTANSNYGGFRINAAGRQIAQDVQILNNTANDNRKEGVAVTSGQDMFNVVVDGNTLLRNGFGITARVQETANDVNLTNNKIEGDNGVGTGIDLDAGNTVVSGNSIRRGKTGVLVRRSDGSAINGNNIARNESFGVDASPLAPGRRIDATNNWWGEPSGPKVDSNPNGIGDRVSENVDFEPWLTEPAVATDVNFQITSFDVPETADTDNPVTICGTITNTGTEEGNQEVTMTVRNEDTGQVIGVKSTTKTVNQSTSTEVCFDFTFPAGGTYTVEFSTANDSQTATVIVTGPTGMTIEQGCDVNGNNRIDDDEILRCIGFWVTGEEVPGTGQSISDSKILFLVELWVTNGDISTLPAQAANQLNWMDSLVSFFAPAAVVTHKASVKVVAPGDSFTVTTTIKAKASLSGLLLAEQLPAGWQLSEATTAGGFFKAAEHKWLWLGGSNITVSYTVTVPQDAAAGVYEIAGNLATSGGFVTSNAMRLRVVHEMLSVSDVSFTGNRFVALGHGITGLEIQLYNLGGGLVFTDASASHTLSFSGLRNDGAQLANGVYLYVVTVQGANGQQMRSDVGKLVILK